MTATLVLVHGAWHGPGAWDQLIAELDGVDVVTVDLPSSGTDPATLGGLYDDAAELSRVLAGIEGPTVVVAHSYGGAVATEAVTADSGVAHLVYLCAFQLDVGESLLGLVGGQAPPWWEVHERHIVALTPEEVFYNRVSPELTASSVAALRLQSRAAVEETVTHAGWTVVQSTYVVCDADQAIPPPAQEMLAQRAGTVVHLDAGHSPFLSQPAEVAAIIRPLLG